MDVSQRGNRAKEPISGTGNATHTFATAMHGLFVSNDSDPTTGTDLTFTLDSGFQLTLRAGETFDDWLEPFQTITITTTAPWRVYGRG